MLSERHKEMEAVRVSAKAEYQQLLQHTYRPPFEPAYFDILQGRLEKGGALRAYFSVLMCRYISASVKKILPFDNTVTDAILPLVVEALIVVMYYDNQIFDRKGGVLTTEAASGNLIKSKLLYGAIHRYLNKKVTNGKTKEELSNLVSDVHDAVVAGQEMERSNNRYQNWITNKITDQSNIILPDNSVRQFVKTQIRNIMLGMSLFPENKMAYLDAYLERIYWTNAYFFERISQFLLDYLAPNHPEKENILRFSALIGIMHQIVNDNADFVPSWANEDTSTKNQSDALSDLRNKNVTLPIAIHLFRCPNGKIEAYLAASEGNHNWSERDFSEEIIEHSIFESIKVGKTLKLICLQLLNAENPHYIFFEDMARVADNNRFYRYFYNRRRSK